MLSRTKLPRHRRSATLFVKADEATFLKMGDVATVGIPERERREAAA